MMTIKAKIKADKIDTDFIVAVLAVHEARIGKPKTAYDRMDLNRTRRLINELKDPEFSHEGECRYG